MTQFKTDCFYFWAEPNYIGPFDTELELIKHFEAEHNCTVISTDDMWALGYPVSTGDELNERKEDNNA